MQYKLTPSKLNLFSECQRCFWLQHNKNIKRPEGIFPSLPSGMDRILKIHFDNYAVKNELPPEIKHLGVKIFKDKILNDWRNNRKGISYEENGNFLRGAVDAILVKDIKLIVLDYKTRGYPLKADTHHHYQNQLNLYNFLLRKNNYKTEDYSYLLFYHPDKIVDNVFLFHSDLIKMKVSVKDAEKLWKDALKLLNSSIPLAAETCNYCKYREAKINATLLDF